MNRFLSCSPSGVHCLCFV